MARNIPMLETNPGNFSRMAVIYHSLHFNIRLHYVNPCQKNIYITPQNFPHASRLFRIGNELLFLFIYNDSLIEIIAINYYSNKLCPCHKATPITVLASISNGNTRASLSKYAFKRLLS